MFLASGVTKKNGELIPLEHVLHAASIIGAYAGRDENNQVNGYAFVMDMTGVGTKQLMQWSTDDMRKWHSCWQVGRLTYVIIICPIAIP